MIHTKYKIQNAVMLLYTNAAPLYTSQSLFHLRDAGIRLQGDYLPYDTRWYIFTHLSCPPASLFVREVTRLEISRHVW